MECPSPSRDERRFVVSVVAGAPYGMLQGSLRVKVEQVQLTAKDIQIRDCWQKAKNVIFQLFA